MKVRLRHWRKALAIAEEIVSGAGMTLKHRVAGSSHLRIEVHSPKGQHRTLTVPSSPVCADHNLDHVRQHAKRAVRELRSSEAPR